MLPSATKEQEHALEVWEARRNQVCSAAAGSGKTTLLLHACQRSVEPVLVVTYNKVLQLETSRRLAEVSSTSVCRTFHGLCSEHLDSAPDDATLHLRLHESENRELSPLPFHRVIVDECQDIKAVFVALLSRLLDPERVQWMLVGDDAQMLYDFDEDDPAELDVMRTPWKHLGGTEAMWERTRLSLSFRLTKPAAAVANAARAAAVESPEDPIRAANLSEEALPTRLSCCSPWSWLPLIQRYLDGVLKLHANAQVAILCNSIRDTNIPLKRLVNKLRVDVPLRVGRPAADAPPAPGGFVAISTFHSAKGAEFDFVIVLAEARLAPNALHVGLTRARRHTFIVQSSAQPHPALLALDALPESCVDRDFAWIQWRQHPSTARAWKPSGLQPIADLTSFRPRGRCVRLSEEMSVHDIKRREGIESALAKERTPPSEALRCYEIAVRMAAEQQASGQCRLLSFLASNPHPVARERVENLVRSGSHERVLLSRADAEELLPPLAHIELQRVSAPFPKTSIDWVTAAVCAVLWDSYHHTVDDLLPAEEWADGAVVEEGVRSVRAHLEGQQNLVYDSVCVTELEGRLLHCRCFAASEDAVVSVILANDVGREEMLAACIPLAVHPKATRALLINVRSGDMHIMKLRCKEAFLREVLRMRGF